MTTLNARDARAETAIADRLELALAAARAAGAASLALFQSPALTHIAKPDGSPVTPADKDAETLIRALVQKSFPRDSIVGEEFPPHEGDSGFTWIIDPIDGTRSFVKGIPTWACLIGIEHNGAPAAGVAVYPALREELWAMTGSATNWKHGACTAHERMDIARVSAVEILAQAIVETVHVRSFRTSSVQSRPDVDLAMVFERLAQRTQRLRTWNDAYSLALVATGRVDAAFGYKVNAWDLAPFAAIFAGAGGTLQDWAGTPTIHAGQFVAGNSHLCAALRSVLVASA